MTSQGLTPGEIASMDQAHAGIDWSLGAAIEEYHAMSEGYGREEAFLTLLHEIRFNSHEALAQHCARAIQRLAEHEPSADPSLSG